MNNKKEGHGASCDCGECIATEEEYLVDLTEAINVKGVYCLNEKTQDTAKKIFKNKEKMLDRADYLESNDGDPELLLYIPFNSAVKMKSMIIIGGEEGTCPALIKLYVNVENPDFDLIDGSTATQVYLIIYVSLFDRNLNALKILKEKYPIILGLISSIMFIHSLL